MVAFWAAVVGAGLIHGVWGCEWKHDGACHFLNTCQNCWNRVEVTSSCFTGYAKCGGCLDNYYLPFGHSCEPGSAPTVPPPPTDFPTPEPTHEPTLHPTEGCLHPLSADCNICGYNVLTSGGACTNGSPVRADECKYATFTSHPDIMILYPANQTTWTTRGCSIDPDGAYFVYPGSLDPASQGQAGHQPVCHCAPSTTTSTTSTSTTSSTTITTSTTTNTWLELIVDRVLISGGKTEAGNVPGLPGNVVSDVLYEMVHSAQGYTLVQLGSAHMWQRYGHSMVSLTTPAASYTELQCAIGDMSEGGASPSFQCAGRENNEVDVPQPDSPFGSHTAAAVSGDNVVVLGGGSRLSASNLTSNWTTDTASVWGAVGAAVAATASHVYVIGGTAGRVYQLDAFTLHIVNNYSLPQYAAQGVHGHAAAAVGSTVYVIGGCVGANATNCACSDHGAMSNDHGQSWTSVTLQTARCEVAAVLHDNYDRALWIIGGIDSNETVHPSVEVLLHNKTAAQQHPLKMSDGAPFNLKWFAATLRPEWSITSTTHTSTTTTVPPYGRMYVAAANQAFTLDSTAAIVSNYVASGKRHYYSLVYHNSWLCAVGGKNAHNNTLFGSISCALVENPDEISARTPITWGSSWWGNGTAIPDLKTPVFGATAVMFRGTLTVIGGYDGQNNIATTQYLDTSGAPQWKHLAAQGGIKPVRDGAVVAASDGYLYLFGGRNSDVLNTIYFLSDINDPFGWQAVVTGDKIPTPLTLPEPAYGLSAVELDRVIYIIGGAGAGGACTSTVTLFYLETLTLGTAPSLSTGRCFTVSSVLNNAIIVTGATGTMAALAPIDSHDVLYNNTWSTINWTHGHRLNDPLIAGTVVLNTEAITITTTTATGSMLPMKRRPTWAPGPPPPKSHKLDGPDGAIGIGTATGVAFVVLVLYARCAN